MNRWVYRAVNVWDAVLVGFLGMVALAVAAMVLLGFGWLLAGIWGGQAGADRYEAALAWAWAWGPVWAVTRAGLTFMVLAVIPALVHFVCHADGTPEWRIRHRQAAEDLQRQRARAEVEAELLQAAMAGQVDAPPLPDTRQVMVPRRKRSWWWR
jgi:hypothetical protein